MFRMNLIPVVYENDEILLINKPAGLACQGGKGVTHSLDEELPLQTGFKIHLVHRLDKETCGLMVVAKNPAAARKWIELIASKQVKKEYAAVCFGHPVLNGKKCDKGTITDYIIKDGRKLEAVTHFKVVASKVITVPEEIAAEKGIASFELTRLHLTLGTGRMHQIRIHLAKASAPIAGDDTHGNFKLNKLARKVCGIKNLLLESQTVTLPVGAGGNPVTFSIDLAQHFETALFIPPSSC